MELASLLRRFAATRGLVSGSKRTEATVTRPITSRKPETEAVEPVAVSRADERGSAMAQRTIRPSTNRVANDRPTSWAVRRPVGFNHIGRWWTDPKK